MNDGLARLMPEPPHEIRGATRADQAWIDETVAAGVASLGWQIKPRPAGLDPAPVPAAKAKPKKKNWRQRLGIAT